MILVNSKEVKILFSLPPERQFRQTIFITPNAIFALEESKFNTLETTLNEIKIITE